MRKIVLTFGLIAGAILSALMLITLPFQEQIGFDKGALIGYTTMVLAFLMVYFGVRSYRDNVAGGHVTFGRALKVGLTITAIASACYVMTWQLIYYQFAPDFVDKYAAYTVEKAKQSGATDADIAARVQQMAAFKEMYKNPLLNIALTLLEPLPIGILFTLVTAGMLSRKRRAESTAMRSVIAMLTLTLISGQAQPVTGQTLPADVGSGRIAWFDLTTTNLSRSKDFYAQLFGWEFAPVQGTDQAAEIVAGGTAIGTLRGADGAISVFNGVVYVQVIDVLASCRKAKTLGGTVVPGFPFNLPGGIGAICLVVDPGGHPVGLYSRTPLPADPS